MREERALVGGYTLPEEPVGHCRGEPADNGNAQAATRERYLLEVGIVARRLRVGRNGMVADAVVRGRLVAVVAGQGVDANPGPREMGEVERDEVKLSASRRREALGLETPAVRRGPLERSLDHGSQPEPKPRVG